MLAEWIQTVFLGGKILYVMLVLCHAFTNPQLLRMVLTVQVSPPAINHKGKSIELLGFMWV